MEARCEKCVHSRISWSVPSRRYRIKCSLREKNPTGECKAYIELQCPELCRRCEVSKTEWRVVDGVPMLCTICEDNIDRMGTCDRFRLYGADADGA